MKEVQRMAARKKASKKSASKKRAPARRPAAKKAVAKKPAAKVAPPKAPVGPPSAIGLLSQHIDYTTLSAKGVQFERPPADMPWGHRVISTIDPEGRRVMLATSKQKRS